MEEFRKDMLTNRQLDVIQRYRSRIRQVEQKNICHKILSRETNSLDFYKITPKDELPIFLQKMKFQTLHLKENITSSVKVFKKENRKPIEQRLRKKVKDSGNIMLLSEIYQNLGEAGVHVKNQSLTQFTPYPEQPNELDQWEKKQIIKKGESTEPRVARDSKEIGSARGFREGCDYKGEIQRGLQIIDVTHGSQGNLLNRYMLIENSSKLLKKELEDKKLQIQESIKSRMKLLYQARTQYHSCFEEKNRLYMEQKVLREDPKDQILRVSHKSLNSKIEKSQKRSMMEINENRISKTKKNIEGLEEAIFNLEEELKRLLQAEKLYYKLILKNGTDVRESGLVWVIQKLEVRESDMSQYQFPAYLDKKGRQFLIQKCLNQEQKQILLEEKRKFVNQIGKSTSENKFRYRSILNPKDTIMSGSGDKIVERFRPDNDIPKKYRKSQRKMSALAEQFFQNSSLLELKTNNRQVEISADLEGLTNKEIYNKVGQRIKNLDLTKIKKEKLGAKGARLMEYQSLLEKIKNAHIKEQEMDLQHENYLLSQYRDNRNTFFMQAAACFGYKRAYSMIIKHYSWKNYSQQTLVKRGE